MDEPYAVRVLDALDPGTPQVRSHYGKTLIA
jgi:hypothetical protein